MTFIIKFTVVLGMFLDIITCQNNATAESQPNVITEKRKHSLYLWIFLRPTSNYSRCVKYACDFPAIVDKVSPPLSENDEIMEAGVGFGSKLYKLVAQSNVGFEYYHRRGPLGDMPDSGGDIFVHAKCNTYSKLIELADLFLHGFPAGCIRFYEDTYSFVYRYERDLSGFIDGTANPSGVEDRTRVAVVPETGGSFCLTQKWVHDLERIRRYNDSTLEFFIGRSRNDSSELQNKSDCSHIARMTGGTAFDINPKFEIVRQSQPYGSFSNKAGLFFIAFSTTVDSFNFMLDNMVGRTLDRISDCLMKISQAISGNFWYFPGVQELENLKISL